MGLSSMGGLVGGSVCGSSMGSHTGSSSSMKFSDCSSKKVSGFSKGRIDLTSSVISRLGTGSGKELIDPRT